MKFSDTPETLYDNQYLHFSFKSLLTSQEVQYVFSLFSSFPFFKDIDVTFDKDEVAKDTSTLNEQEKFLDRVNEFLILKEIQKSPEHLDLSGIGLSRIPQYLIDASEYQDYWKNLKTLRINDNGNNFIKVPNLKSYPHLEVISDENAIRQNPITYSQNYNLLSPDLTKIDLISYTKKPKIR